MLYPVRTVIRSFKGFFSWKKERDDQKLLSLYNQRSNWTVIKTLCCVLLLIISLVSCEKKMTIADPVNLCDFPDDLKQAVEKKLGKNCQNLDYKDLSKIKILKVQNVTLEQTSEQNNKSEYLERGKDFTALEELDLSNNPNMKKIPDFVYSLPKLKKLNISHTGISNFSGKMCQLKELTTLIASHNNYEGREVPIATFCLFQLQVLDMSSSELRYVDEYLYYLKNLKKFYLQDNNLGILPYTIHELPSLLVLDLRNNLFSDAAINSLTDCTSLEESSEEQKECQRDLSHLVECEWWYQMPFKRGKDFHERYTEMTGQVFLNNGEVPDAGCRNTWLNDYVSYYDPSKSYLLELTANGKTIREWRLLYDKFIIDDDVRDGIKDEPGILFENMACQYHAKGISLKNGIGNSIYHFFMPRNTNWAPGMAVSNPERYRQPDEARFEYCNPIDYNTPQPEQPLGPWSAALPTVQEAIDKIYPHPESCEYWPTSRCPFQSEIPDAVYYLGVHSVQDKELFKDVYRKLHEDRKNFKDFPSTRAPLVRRLQRDENEKRYKQTEEYFSKSVEEQEAEAEEAWQKYHDILEVVIADEEIRWQKSQFNKANQVNEANETTEANVANEVHYPSFRELHFPFLPIKDSSSESNPNGE